MTGQQKAEWGHAWKALQAAAEAVHADPWWAGADNPTNVHTELIQVTKEAAA
ncbi:hypothetical protein ACSNOI_10190 [Actinomadura kijaniata]|uniref:hypothetical protein n=1 Tax=Actinomadura kijaniata TaxID=46161 RepID=UPI003F1E3F8F